MNKAMKKDTTYKISQGSLNLVNSTIQAYESFLEKVEKLPKKAVFVSILKSQLILEIKTTLSLLRKIKKEATD